MVRRHFKPEFLNRLDDVVVFHALATEELTSGSSTSRSARSASGWRSGGSRWTSSPAAREWLALNGFDPVYGARPLRRLVQSAIGDQLAKALLAGEIRDGDTVRVDITDDSSALIVGRAL